jgi:hypothetical protein
MMLLTRDLCRKDGLERKDLPGFENRQENLSLDGFEKLQTGCSDFVAPRLL